MRESEIEYFKKLFNSIVDDNAAFTDKHLKLVENGEKLHDQVDMAMEERERALMLKIKGRRNLYLKKISKAIDRIDEGTFGTCLECEDQISIERLMARPTAILCIMCKEEREREERSIPYKRRSHTHGQEIASSNVVPIRENFEVGIDHEQSINFNDVIKKLRRPINQ